MFLFKTGRVRRGFSRKATLFNPFMSSIKSHRTHPQTTSTNTPNYTLDPENKIKLPLYWDPSMNSSYSQLIRLAGTDHAPPQDSDRPALLVLVLDCGTRFQDPGGPPTREARIEAAIDATKNAKPRIRSTSVEWVDSPERLIHLTWVNVSSITRCMVPPLKRFRALAFKSLNGVPTTTLALRVWGLSGGRRSMNSPSLEVAYLRWTLPLQGLRRVSLVT